MSQPMIEIVDFSLSFGGRQVLKNVSVVVGEGEYLSIVGPNGAGKTTLLRCVMGILRGGPGTIRIAGRDLTQYGRKDLAKRIAYVPQANDLQVPYRVDEFVLMGRYPYIGLFSSPGSRDQTALRKALRLTGMETFADRILDTLSGGERQIACIAAAIAQEPMVLLLDEPTTFLDPFHRSAVREILKRLHLEVGVTILCVTHDINYAVLSSDRVLALRDGAQVYLGPPEDLLRNDVLEPLYGKRFLFSRHPETGSLFVVPD